MTETTMKHPCPKCKKDMLMTPVCTECGIIPIAEGSFTALKMEIERLRQENEQLRLRIAILEVNSPICVV